MTHNRLSTGGHSRPPFRIVGHRGSAFDCPENTLASFDRAWRDGADGVELDVHLSADGVPVVVHDADLRRTAGIDAPVASLPVSRLCGTDVGAWKGPAFAGQLIPTLESVLAAMPPAGVALVEVKAGRGDEPGLLETLACHAGRVEVQSFSFDILAVVHRRLPNLRKYWLWSGAEPGHAGIDRAVGAGFHGIALQHTGVTAGIAESMHRRGLTLLAWTVNDLDAAAALVDAGVDTLITDRPGFLLRHLRP